MTLSFGHGGGGSPLNFEAGNVEGERVEAKICEWCTRMFFRPVNADGQSMLRGVCEGCKRRAAKAKAREAAPVPLPENRSYVSAVADRAVGMLSGNVRMPMRFQ
jgi:hypothetical protein